MPLDAGSGFVKYHFYFSSQRASYTGATPRLTTPLHTLHHVPQQRTTLVHTTDFLREIDRSDDLSAQGAGLTHPPIPDLQGAS